MERKYVVQVLDTVRHASKTVYNNYDIIVYSWKILDTYASLGHLRRSVSVKTDSVREWAFSYFSKIRKKFKHVIKTNPPQFHLTKHKTCNTTFSLDFVTRRHFCNSVSVFWGWLTSEETNLVKVCFKTKISYYAFLTLIRIRKYA